MKNVHYIAQHPLKATACYAVTSFSAAGRHPNRRPAYIQTTLRPAHRLGAVYGAGQLSALRSRRPSRELANPSLTTTPASVAGPTENAHA